MTDLPERHARLAAIRTQVSPVRGLNSNHYTSNAHSFLVTILSSFIPKKGPLGQHAVRIFMASCEMGVF